MIFWILMNLNNIFSFLNLKPKTTIFFITDVNFTGNLTNKSYFARSSDDLNCKSANVVYGFEYDLCGLVYVGETKGKLRKRICSHRPGIINNVNETVFQHFNQPIRSFQCEFVSSKIYTIRLTI